MPQKYCRKFEPPEQGARTLQTTDDRHTDGRQQTAKVNVIAKKCNVRIKTVDDIISHQNVRRPNRKVHYNNSICRKHRRSAHECRKAINIRYAGNCMLLLSQLPLSAGRLLIDTSSAVHFTNTFYFVDNFDSKCRPTEIVHFSLISRKFPRIQPSIKRPLYNCHMLQRLAELYDKNGASSVGLQLHSTGSRDLFSGRQACISSGGVGYSC